MFDLSTKTGKTFKALVLDGEKLTESQAKKRFGIGNLRAEVSRVRQAGYAVYADTRIAANGMKVTEYRHGTPSRTIVAAGYRALSVGL